MACRKFRIRYTYGLHSYGLPHFRTRDSIVPSTMGRINNICICHNCICHYCMVMACIAMACIVMACCHFRIRDSIVPWTMSRMHVVARVCPMREMRPAACHPVYSSGLYSYGIYSCGLYSYGLYNYGLYSYGLPKARDATSGLPLSTLLWPMKGMAYKGTACMVIQLWRTRLWSV